MADYPDDPRKIWMPCGLNPHCYQVNLNDEAFTYSQATAGIVMLNQEDLVDAGKIFNFYNSEWFNPSDGAPAESGFFTVYDKNWGATPGHGRVEYNKIMSPTAWIAIFSLQYYAKTGDERALTLATHIGKWIQTLPHQDGGVAMSTDNPSGVPNYGKIYSVENNLTYYALLNNLSVQAKTDADRQSFTTEKANLANWLRTKAYDPTTGLFRRGTTDTISFGALDSNTWAISALGVDGVRSLLNFNDQQFTDYIRRIEQAFSVQNPGSFGGDILTAKGFDFSDAQNAARIGRTGIVWVEGTNEMIQDYEMISNYYASKGMTSLAVEYQSKADHFLSLNTNNSISQNGQLSYTYSDKALTQIWSDDGNNKTSTGSAIDSTAWVYFAINDIDPFYISQ